MFVRDSTGLVKKVSFLDAVSLNVSNMSIGPALTILGFTTILLPTMAGVNLVVASVIGFILAIPQVVIYTMLSVRFPRTGGDYVWVSRSLGGFIGGTLSFAGITTMSMAYNALVSLAAVAGVGAAGLALGYVGMAGLASLGTEPLTQFSLAFIFFAILLIVNIFLPKVGIKIVSGLFIVGVLTLVLSVAVILSAGQAGVVNYINSLGLGLTYDSVAASYAGQGFSLSNTVFILPFFALFVYPWINGGPALASEIKGKSALRWNTLASLILAFILITSGIGVMYLVGGYDFINAALSNPTLVNNGFSFWTLAIGVSNNPWLQWIISIGWVAWDFAVVAYVIIQISRYVLAQAFDRFLPSVFAYVSPKYGSPIAAHVLDLIVTTGLLAVAAYFYGSFVFLYYAILPSMVYYAFVGISAAAYGRKAETGKARATLMIFGLLSAAIFAYFTYDMVTFYQIWGGNEFSFLWVAGVLIAGGLIYVLSKSYHAKHGIDITLAYKQLPPE